LTGVHIIKPDIVASGNTWVETRSEFVRDGNIVTTWVTPFYYVWIREFLTMLNERGIKPSSGDHDRRSAAEARDTNRASAFSMAASK
jgi:hypothetical protein